MVFFFFLVAKCSFWWEHVFFVCPCNFIMVVGLFVGDACSCWRRCFPLEFLLCFALVVSVVVFVSLASQSLLISLLACVCPV